MKNSTENIKVTFCKDNKDSEAVYSVIAAKHNGRWVFCRHKDRTTYEVPGGHIEAGETPDEAAKRELFEETGALDFDIYRVSTYGVIDYGVLYFADIKSFGKLPNMEMAEIIFSDNLPDNLTYPHIQPYLFEYVENWLKNNSNLTKRKYSTLIFDLDGTLFDHFGAVDRAVDNLYENIELFHKLPLSKFKELYYNIEEKYFDMYRTGALTWEEQRIFRMKALYSHFGVRLTDDSANDKFMEFLKLYEDNWRLFDESYDLLTKVKRAGYKIAMITNGEMTQQQKKIKTLGIDVFFELVVSSSEHDFRKPEKEIFQYAFDKLNVKKDDVLYIGDSIKSDIQGANNAQIDSVYIVGNHNKGYHIEHKPTFIIHNLDELYPILMTEE